MFMLCGEKETGKCSMRLRGAEAPDQPRFPVQPCRGRFYQRAKWVCTLEISCSFFVMASGGKQAYELETA